MNFTKETLTVLENYSTLNDSLVFNMSENGYLSAKTPSKTVLSFYKLPKEETEIPGFYTRNLNQLLDVIKEVKNEPGFEILFKETYLILKCKGFSFTFHYSAQSLMLADEKELIERPKDDNEWLKEPKIVFTLKTEHLKKILKMVSLLPGDQTDIIISTKKGKILAECTDTENPDSNSFKISLGKNQLGDVGEYSIAQSPKDWLMIPDYDYKVEIDPEVISRYTAVNDDMKLEYYIGFYEKG